MTNRLEAVTVDYTDTEPWRSYFKQLHDFAETARALSEFRRELLRTCDGMPYDQLQEVRDCSQVLLGGVDVDGTYRERSLAKLYSELLGLRFENLTDALEKQRLGLSPSTTVVVEDTPFATFVDEALELAETVLQQAHEHALLDTPDVVTTDAFDDLLFDQAKLSQLLSDFMQGVQAILPNYEVTALVVWTLDHSTSRYLSVAYPELTDHDPWTWLTDAFGLEPIFTPSIDEVGENVTERENEYTVYAYRNGSLGYTLIDLYRLVWNAFDGNVRDSLDVVFPDVPNFKQEFLNEAHDRLDAIGWAMPDNLRTVSEGKRYSGTRGDTTKAEYNISGITLDSYHYQGYNTKNKYDSYVKESNIPVLRVLDDLAPGLFLLHGLEYELDITPQSLEVVER